ncbi:MAG: acyl-CoA/acyl-ACP dehydrogenase [Rhodospirillaceae bacterium]|jgi:alkylation response protein AidB-like acyl-CoA dehydrogenase|nr:acyl-CoA/acyl-ACP dehydrogenase [Rhodospirillaceae bacterium]MBT5192016.1 acyl-CoA/acyl-ACP dehydrogenase [Rhodospirillaceae bacterium]MBT5896377.1 acyl-CoA/acyl-ACP dehydrogenase [Rhodospirillaceae bacterium]MBT6426035.1 acyl-CoA/acyl-ACP dehydrogenase [Rhodospirillaceae bacterium]
MSFSFTDEQMEFRSVLRRFLADKSPTTEVRRLMETEDGYDREVWRQLSQDLGLTAIHIPEDYGGQGFGFVELAIAVEEMGRALLCAPYFSSIVLAATAIMNAGDEDQKRDLLPPIAAGDCRAALAFTEENGRWDTDGVEMTATASGVGYELNGVKSFVLDGHTADMIVVLARRPGSAGEEGLSFFTVPGDTQGLTRRLLKSTDTTRKLARLEFQGVKATLLGSEGAAAAPLAKTLDQAVACLANEMVGGAEALREQALDYAQMRMQFGRAIASFQTMKHKSADMLIEVELAKSAAYYAAAAADDGDELPAMASLAKAGASETYIQTAIHTIQIHGGIGFTWDNDTQLWFKRAKSSQVFLGDAHYHREQMMQRWQG